MLWVFTSFLVRFPDGSLLFLYSANLTKQKTPASPKPALRCERVEIIVWIECACLEYARMVLRFENVLRYKQLVLLPLWHVAYARANTFWQQHLSKLNNCYLLKWC